MQKEQLNSIGGIWIKKIERKGMYGTVLDDKQYFIVTTKDGNGIDTMPGGMLKSQCP